MRRVCSSKVVVVVGASKRIHNVRVSPAGTETPVVDPATENCPLVLFRFSGPITSSTSKFPRIGAESPSNTP